MDDTTPAYGLWSLVAINSLVFMYVRLARREEQEVGAEFGEAYRSYAERTPAFVPRFRAEPRHA